MWVKALLPYCVQSELFNNYYIINRLIGEGAYSKVYHVTRKSDNENFAAKMLKKDQMKANNSQVLIFQTLS